MRHLHIVGAIVSNWRKVVAVYALGVLSTSKATCTGLVKYAKV